MRKDKSAAVAMKVLKKKNTVKKPCVVFFTKIQKCIHFFLTELCIYYIYIYIFILVPFWIYLYVLRNNKAKSHSVQWWWRDDQVEFTQPSVFIHKLYILYPFSICLLHFCNVFFSYVFIHFPHWIDNWLLLLLLLLLLL